MNKVPDNCNHLYDKIAELIDAARSRVKTAVNTAMVYTYYEIGRYIVEDEQNGKSRAEYGKNLIKDLSAKLTERYGKGWTSDNLKLFRRFYSVYSNRGITDSPIQNDNHCLSNCASDCVDSVDSSFTTPNFRLSWTHYIVLMRIKDPNERSFYEIECRNQDWSVRQLQRQVASSLYERLALSRNKDDVMRLAIEGHTLTKPKDIIKDPLTLEFLGLKPDESYSESKLESAVLSKIQKFLLEMGKGFLFEKRQKRFTFDEDHYYVDLVLYNRLLQCYVLIDFKVDKLAHQDLGQMQMYVNYYDRYVKQDFEKPTIGILLCKEKNDALVELTLPKDANIFAAQYQLYLPDKKLLQAKVKQWILEFEENNIDPDKTD